MAQAGDSTAGVTGAAGPAAAGSFALEGSLAEVQEWFAERGWTDGLPIVPPTDAAVAELLQEVDEPGDAEVGEIPPLGTLATVSQVAANAVMAGCRPLHFRTVLAAVRALLRPEFNLSTVQTTTHPVAVLVIVHGPEARRIGVNGKTGVFGPGFVANAVIGRAVRLVLMNLGGGRPGVRDFATQGAPGKFTYCMAENADDSPWPEFHTTRGFAADASAVTVAGVEGPHSVNDHESTTPARNLDLVADVMGRLGSNNWFASERGSDIVVVLGPEHAAMAGDAGWTRADVQRYLYHRSMRPATDLPKGGQFELRTWSPWLHALFEDPTARMPIVEAPDDIIVLVAGGPGKWSSVMTTMGNISRAVTVPVYERTR
jgi:hypothetical protein